MKTTNKLAEIFAEAGYAADFDNRSQDVKALNKAMDAGLVLTLVKKGFVKTKSNGFKWNVWMAVGKNSIAVKMKYVSPYCILYQLAKAIKNDSFKLKVGTEYKLAEPCSKCNGNGIIPYYHFYCDGICFDCLGLGYKGEYTLVNI